MGTRRFIGESVIIILVLVIAIWYLGILFRPLDTDGCIDRINKFHSAPEDSFDVICYGSSHGLCAFDTPMINRDLGIRAYNYSNLWQQINTERLFLEDSLRTQHPKVVIIETYRVNDVIIEQDIDGEVYYTRAISDFPGKRKYLKQCLGNDLMLKLQYYVPFVAFHENWMNVERESFWRHDGSRPYDDDWGFEGREDVEPIHFYDDSLETQKELSSEAIECLEDIVSDCHENGIKVIFCTVPYGDVYEYNDAMTVFAANHGCEYINFFNLLEEIGIDEQKDFADSGHLASSGAGKITKYLEKYLTCK